MDKANRSFSYCQRMRTGGGQGKFAIEALGSDQPAHDSQAEAAHSANDGSVGCALGPHQAVCNGDDSGANEHAHQKIHISAHAQMLVMLQVLLILSDNVGSQTAANNQ